MDSMDLEREKGITILAKNTAVRHGDLKINIVDTPGPRGLRRRGRARADDGRRRAAAGGRREGPLPQTRFVLRKSLEAHLPVILVVNKVDRPDARVEGGRRRGLPALPGPRRRRAPDRVPDPVRQRAGRAMRAGPGRSPADLEPLFDALRTHIPAPGVRGGPSAPGAGDEPRRLAVRRAARALPGAERHDPTRAGGRVVPGRRHDRAGEDRRALRSRGARPRRGRGGRAGRDHRGRRHRRDHDRRDARRSRRPAAAAGDPRRRAVALDDDRHQHLAAVRQGRRQAHRAPGEGAAGRRGGRQRLDPRARRRPARPVGGAGARRAPAGGPRRDDAPRGVRAHGRQAAGRHAHDRREAPRAGGARRDRRARGVPRA